MALAMFGLKAIDVFGYIPQNYGHSKYKKNLDIDYDIKYSNIDEDCLLDIYRPKNSSKSSKKLPAILFFHGGGFIAGDKNYRKKYSSFLANLGFVVLNVRYPLCPKFKFHEQVPVFMDAIKWARDNAELYNYNPMDMITAGDSAGGHCASVIIALETSEEYRNKFKLDFPSGIHFSHALMLSGMFYIQKILDPNEKLFLNMNLDIARYMTGLNIKKRADLKLLPTDYPYYKELTAVNFANEKFPNTFIAHVKKDAFCPGQGFILKDILDKTKITYSEYCAKRLFDIHDNQLFNYKKSARECNDAIKKWLLTEYSSYF